MKISDVKIQGIKISDFLILHFYTEEKLTRRCIVCTIKIATLQGSKEKVKNSIKNLELITKLQQLE